MIHQLDKDAQIEVQNMQKQMFSIATVEKKKCKDYKLKLKIPDLSENLKGIIFFFCIQYEIFKS